MKFSIWLEARVHRSVLRKEPVIDKEHWKKQQRELYFHDMLVRKRKAGKKKI